MSQPYWAMEIAGDYEPKRAKGRERRDLGPLVAVRRVTRTTTMTTTTTTTAASRFAAKCHIKLLSLCL